MNRDKKKKTLYFVIGSESECEGFIKRSTSINRDEIIILQNDGPVFLQPFGDLMRDIIINVYQHNIEEIVVVSSKDSQKDSEDALTKIYGQKELQEKRTTLDYLLNHCQPEFPEQSLKEWLEGSNSLTDQVEKIVRTLRHHPLIAADIKVSELYLEQANENAAEEMSIF
ncbi:hypothetical protein M3182_21845 [Mesobacillus maritimus]|uniref:hypothetical protein n=1 Tax=Mesobacillus maritimus TaxID=1643336 RepID=UPI00203EF57C|nr:hypothetical protein [Mesobacillus maritimus]MCM3588325.1 hypothetical protein [Mesobacillus maritimus]